MTRLDVHNVKITLEPGNQVWSWNTLWLLFWKIGSGVNKIRPLDTESEKEGVLNLVLLQTSYLILILNCQFHTKESPWNSKLPAICSELFALSCAFMMKTEFHLSSLIAACIDQVGTLDLWRRLESCWWNCSQFWWALHSPDVEAPLWFSGDKQFWKCHHFQQRNTINKFSFHLLHNAFLLRQ